MSVRSWSPTSFPPLSLYSHSPSPPSVDITIATLRNRCHRHPPPPTCIGAVASCSDMVCGSAARGGVCPSTCVAPLHPSLHLPSPALIIRTLNPFIRLRLGACSQTPSIDEYDIRLIVIMSTTSTPYACLPFPSFRCPHTIVTPTLSSLSLAGRWIALRSIIEHA